jgi:hypothetical protein
MRLNRFGREVYAVEVTLDPTASGTWEASFDGGTTWVAGTDQNNGSFGWLVAGPSNDGTGAVFQFATQLSVTPLLRLTVGDEEIVVTGPSIDLA